MRKLIKKTLTILGLIVGSIILGNLQLIGFGILFEAARSSPLFTAINWIAFTGLVGYGTISLWSLLNEEPKNRT